MNMVLYDQIERSNKKPPRLEESSLSNVHTFNKEEASPSDPG